MENAPSDDSLDTPRAVPSALMGPEADAAQRSDELLDQAFARATGATLWPGNTLRLLKDASQNYPAWLEAIASAKRRILFENYIICDDAVGQEFAAALSAKAREGVQVYVIYDWLGSFGRASGRFWRELRGAGVEVRCFNPPRLTAPLSWLHRDHRKLLAVDGRVGFVTGLCLGRMWVGDPARGIAPWRDTGVEVQGPALADLERAFAQVWNTLGTPLEPQELSGAGALPRAGEVSLRIIASRPGLMAILRLDELIAAAARRSLWLTDAYFAGIPLHVQALRSAAQDGVDVRLLVPGSSDIPLLRPLSQAGYRPLLEAGVRVFEWKGSMLHAKTAVADGRWARVGSSNLNVASWIGNYELDALVEDVDFATQMEALYEQDLAQSTEIVLRRRRRRALPGAVSRRLRGWARTRRSREAHARHSVAGQAPGPLAARRMGTRGSASRAAAGALRIGRAVSAALTEQRVLAPTEARLVAAVACGVLAVAGAMLMWPYLGAIPLVVLLCLLSVALFAKAAALHRERRRRGMPRLRVTRSRKPGAPGLPSSDTVAAEPARSRGPAQ